MMMSEEILEAIYEMVPDDGCNGWGVSIYPGVGFRKTELYFNLPDGTCYEITATPHSHPSM